MLVSCFNTVRESFINSSNNKNIVLLGDSILDNKSYVSDGKSVENFLIERNNNVYNLAKDNSKIIDTFNQINNIPIKLNNKNTFIFLSVGGNDILSQYLDKNEDITNTSILKSMLLSYKNLVKSIKNRNPNSNIILLDIYYPNNLTYKRFHSIIKEWNQMLYNYGKKYNYNVLKISEYLTQENDFSFGIEPSSNGGKKIAELILSI